MRATKVLFAVAVVLLVGVSLSSRLPAPWVNGLTSDEMHHLESWRNRYRTDDISPLFMKKIEDLGLLSAPWRDALRRAYDASPLVQRGLIVLADAHPPLFPAMAEVVEATTRSSLVALRLPSLAASLLTIALMYLVGVELRDRTLGLWLAALPAIGFLSQTYAGIGRPYALAQLGVVVVTLAFVRELKAERRSPWRFWLAALFAQLTQWMVWSIVGPLALIVLLRRFREGAGLRTLAVQSWWYALISLVLLAEFVIQVQNPSITGRSGILPFLASWYHFSVASPFAALDPLTGLGALDPWTESATSLLSPAAWIFLIAILLGVVSTLVDRRFMDAGGTAPAAGWIRAGLLVATACSFAVPLATGSTMRFMLIYLVVPMVMAGTGIHWLLRSPRVSQAVLVAVLGLFAMLRVGWPERPYDRIFFKETDYAPIAELIRNEIGEDGAWSGYHYSLCNCLYRHGPLPDPTLLTSEAELVAFLDALPRAEGPTLFFTDGVLRERSRTLRRARTFWEFDGNLVVVKIPAKGRTLESLRGN